MADTKAKTARARSVARLAAVQALYQIEASGVAAKVVVKEFLDHRLGELIEDDQFAKADSEFFSDIVTETYKRIDEIDEQIKGSLSKNWSLGRIDTVARAALRAGTYEIIARPDVPTGVIINEYVDVSKAFFEDNTPGFINGVLDKLAKENR